MVDVQWYPGHMEKARRDMQESLKAVDLIVEIRDARVPDASRNPLLDTMGQGKGRLIVLSKADLADPVETQRWIDTLTKEDQKAMALDIAHDPSAKKIVLEQLHELGKPKIERMVRRGIRPRALRAMVCGIPNAGKSTLINRISGKNRVRTEDRPGVTRSLAWIHADKTMDLLDTPGVLWPKFDDPRTGSLLAATGAVNESILDLKEIAMDTMHVIRQYYPDALSEAYQCDPDTRIDVMLEKIAAARHALKENNEPDTDRAAVIFLHELREGKLGRITLEHVDA
ncbi:MAG: ribosome biogenesis GTPase YlqF [Galactobacillus timonensis]|uniref:ribosome biogenesis GTPase YlqF n=1 Tax=Galactobacillus timonensis TaxID=2041840 RepID=UPI000EE8B2CB|nr:ribosome biogenesis GTPase YlqF [Galactobacillus timonensis]MDY5222531.1 ribosome biogenesis GTPase YlqF [Lachnospiraceae bacterium]HCW55346.1 ribosome biogenesis GTPase YlqF [Erysipelotrichaceae bacterium]MCI6068098.1 ribosome biogenesis GTPase YlqF [Galactobacillus timonensis]MCI6753571.1 ribosome biogenesis GTPase YlqF [Galactobacillus timonensis]MDD5852244.1 ribosome biogenesis GTPase YlqF [Galactobacillus timonensis]